MLRTPLKSIGGNASTPRMSMGMADELDAILSSKPKPPPMVTTLDSIPMDKNKQMAMLQQELAEERRRSKKVHDTNMEAMKKLNLLQRQFSEAQAANGKLKRELQEQAKQCIRLEERNHVLEQFLAKLQQNQNGISHTVGVPCEKAVQTDEKPALKIAKFLPVQHVEPAATEPPMIVHLDKQQQVIVQHAAVVTTPAKEAPVITAQRTPEQRVTTPKQQQQTTPKLIPMLIVPKDDTEKRAKSKPIVEDTENVAPATTQRALRPRNTSKTLAEPSLRSKLRRGDSSTFGMSLEDPEQAKLLWKQIKKETME